MREQTIAVESKDIDTIFKLGPLECVSSSLINALIMMKRDYRYFLLNYWSIEYFNKLLLGSRNINLCFLDKNYGIKIKLKKGSLEDVQTLVESDTMVIMKCMASQLCYFPKSMLGYEDRGLGHTFLIYGFDQVNKVFQIIDSMADFKGEVSFEQLGPVKERDGYYSYFVLEKDALFISPSVENIFFHALDYNYKIFTQKVFHFGIKAFKLFQADIEKSLQWSRAARDNWILQNKLSISSIINNRNTVWNCFKEFKIIRTEEEALMDDLIDNLVSDWKVFIFLLLKYKTVSNPEAVLESVIKRLTSIKELEEAVLLKMKSIGTVSEKGPDYGRI